MTKKPVIITGLEISSTKISAAAVETRPDGASTVLAYESQPSKGIYRASITDLAEASNSVSKVLAKLGRKTGSRPDNIYVNITGDTVKGERSRGMIPLTSRGREVTRPDIARCINAASTIRLTFDREIIHRIPLNFSIDDQPVVKNALGLYASRLSCEMYMVTASMNHIQNIYKCVNNAGYDRKEVIYSGLADGASLLEEQQKEEGVVLINIGATITETSFFYSGSLCLADVLPSGANDIKGDLKDGAELSGIVSHVRSKIDEVNQKGGIASQAVITGGFSFREGIIDMLETGLSLPVRMGSVRSVQGNISSMDSLRGATAIGLAKYAGAQYKSAPFQPKNLVRAVSDRVTDIINSYF
ncbi:MAG: cell division protein FtsA [Candidatus Omnitrophica bacterium]|nr:cell division protein FtsA [Candidatus Omnitrophota bacterium]